LHPGPMNRGLEISAEAADSTRSVVVEQVANGVSVRMAVLYLLLGGAQPAIGGVAGPALARAPLADAPPARAPLATHVSEGARR
ncbi:MAG: hypothetical protein ACYCXA_14260, partial [Actinomycetes bacterium]